MRRVFLALALSLSVVAILAGCGGGGSSDPGIISGAVTDAASAASLTADSITLLPAAGTIAPGAGTYSISDVPPGDYLLTVEAAGYSIVTVAVTVTPGGTTTKNITMVGTGSLLAYYPFAGNAADPVGGHNGTVQNAVPAADMFGRTDSAYSFDGAGDRISIPSIWSNPTQVTVAAWVRPATLSGPDQYFLDHGDGGGFYLKLYQDDYSASARLTSGASYGVGATGHAQTIWQHVAAVWDKGQYVKIFVNGSLIGTNLLAVYPAGANGLYDTDAACSIGSAFNGLIDEVYVYNRVLSDAEIAALAQH